MPPSEGSIGWFIYRWARPTLLSFLILSNIMISTFRLRFFSLRLLAALTALGRGLMVGALALILGFSAVGAYAQPAQAAHTPEAKAYDAGPIRQSRNPLSGENFQGGVDPSAIDRRAAMPEPPEQEAQGVLESLKDAVQDVLPGESADRPTASVDLNTQRNPTLKRYGADQQ